MARFTLPAPGAPFPHPRSRAESIWLSALDELQFSTLDPRWLRTIFEYLANKSSAIPYRAGLDNVLNVTLRPNATIALVGDAGTGSPAATMVMEQMALAAPDLVIFLGDNAYYSGTRSEYQKRFFEPVERIFGETPVFALCGNHDVYSGGAAYYDAVDELGQGASYFCIRNENWQILAMDTGASDFDPFEETGNFPCIARTEEDWLNDKLKDRRKNILLSHHQPFSAYESIGGLSSNNKLLNQIETHNAVAWFCGHEHKLAIYSYSAGTGIDRLRVLGAGAIPELAAVPAEVKFPLVPVIPVAVGNNGLTVNQSYALLELSGAKCQARYYEVAGGLSKLLYQETF